MLRFRAIVPLPFLLAALAAQAPEPPAPAAPDEAVAEPSPPAAIERIRQADLLAHAIWLADDERGGRLTGSPGQEEAASYIADHFRELGLEPLGDEVDGERGFRQLYPIARTRLLPETALRFGSLALDDGFALLGKLPARAEIAGKVRFLGMGRTRGTKAELGEGEELDGAIAVVALRQPRGRLDRALPIEQKYLMSFGSLSQLGRTSTNLGRRGAGAVVVLLLEDPFGLADVLNYVALSPRKDLVEARFEDADPPLGGLGRMLNGGDTPTIVLSLAASEQLCAELGIDRAALAAFVAGEGELPAAHADRDGKVVLAVEHQPDVRACNVVAVLRGSDEKLAHEAVVFSAHMDHVGRRMDGDVFNGADDNASGTAGLMAIAAAFAKADRRPRRSVIFLSVSGEELGLWGSAWFAEHSPWPIESVVANVNTDMIGRSGPETGPLEVGITPSHEHRAFSTLARDGARFARALGIAPTSADKYFERSDHFNFARKEIPVVFFCNGEHEDYHQVSDTADKLEGDRMERIARLAFWTGWSAADADEAPSTIGRREDWR